MYWYRDDAYCVIYCYMICYIQYMQKLGIFGEYFDEYWHIVVRILFTNVHKRYGHQLYKWVKIPKIPFQSACHHFNSDELHLNGNSLVENCIFWKTRQKMCTLRWNCKMLSDYKQSDSFSRHGLIKPLWNIKYTTFSFYLSVFL